MHNAELAARVSAVEVGWIAFGEKLNRSLCSLKIKLFLGGTHTMQNAEWAARGDAVEAGVAVCQ
jgi:hypothetical protein